MKHLTAAAAVAIALLLFAAGCGGGGGTSSTSSMSTDGTSASASGDSASGDANEACAKANEKIAALGQPDNDKAVLEYLEETEQTVDQLPGEVAALNDSGVAAYVEALSKSVNVLNEMSNAARSGNPDGVRELSKELESLHLGKVAQAAGLDTCAEAPGVEA
jgi:hypothetical protein